MFDSELLAFFLSVRADSETKINILLQKFTAVLMKGQTFFFIQLLSPATGICT